MLQEVVQYFLHIDQHLAQFAAQYGAWTYGLLFAIVFCETGLVVTPLLPGDSLLFAAGALAAQGVFNIHALVGLLIFAVFCGDNTNYWLGRWLGVRAFNIDAWFLRQKYLSYTESFYEKYGGRTVIIARFMPIVRTFAPFVAGIGRMPYPRFISFSVVGAVFWVSLLCYASYGFGNLPFVKQHFSWVIVGIIFVSIVPPIVEYLRKRIQTA